MDTAFALMGRIDGVPAYFRRYYRQVLCRAALVLMWLPKYFDANAGQFYLVGLIFNPF